MSGKKHLLTQKERMSQRDCHVVQSRNGEILTYNILDRYWLSRLTLQKSDIKSVLNYQNKKEI